MTLESDWQGAVETAEQTYGSLSILINNAGIVRMAPLDETSLEAWHEVINVNQTGVFLGMKHAIPACAGGWGIDHQYFIGSRAGRTAEHSRLPGQ